MNTSTPKITPFLWFDNQAEEAMNFYTGLFNDARIVTINRYPEGFEEGPMAGMAGKVIYGLFELAGYQFMALDGGPLFKFTPAISFFVNCDTEAEIDALWAALSEGGEVAMPLQAYPFSSRFGWIQDKYGLSWQIIPTALGELMSDPDPEKSRRVTEAMLQMKKIEIEGLKRAYEGNQS